MKASTLFHILNCVKNLPPRQGEWEEIRIVSPRGKTPGQIDGGLDLPEDAWVKPSPQEVVEWRRYLKEGRNKQ